MPLRIGVLILFSCLLASASPLLAAESQRHDASSPIDITADRLEADDQAGYFIFEGRVQAKQDNAIIYAKTLTVYYDQVPVSGAEKGQAQRRIERAVAEGDVRIVQQDRIATGQKAEFFQSQGYVVLTGSPKVLQGESQVAGERITVYLDDNRSVVEGGDQGRVRALFVPEKKQ
ncbi:MAG: lipopolysaccharide transport periplasmic protein LptA [Desulfuromonadaceae bacterium]|nr:lipopolysaccharide transport periplasmic protein LptA [Desulfuromonadaceae bacterium]